MRQPINPGIISSLLAYHSKIMQAFKEGKLKEKVATKMKERCKQSQISLAAFYRRTKQSRTK